MTSIYDGSEGRYAHFEGLQTCGSVWDCPCCSSRISNTRRDELNQLLSWGRAAGHTVQMVTLTARHGRGDELADLLSRMKEAKRRWAQHRAYRRLKVLIVGSVTATEVTGGGANGWHPHFHIIIISEGTVDLDELREPWLASLRASGLDGTGAGWRVQDASQAGRYVAKWGAAEEVALGARKKGRVGLTPMQLLAASCDEEDGRAGAFWREYSAAFRGRRQLVWSRGLKALVGVGELEDQEAAQDERQDGQLEEARMNLTADEWSPKDRGRRGAQHRRARLLDAAEADGEEGVRRVVTETGTDEDPCQVELIEPAEPERWKPRPGGLAAAALAEIRKRSEFSEQRNTVSKTKKGNRMTLNEEHEEALKKLTEDEAAKVRAAVTEAAKMHGAGMNGEESERTREVIVRGAFVAEMAKRQRSNDGTPWPFEDEPSI